jgi:hypothetical protein
MIKMWLKVHSYTVLLCFGVVEESAKVHGASPSWSCLCLWLFELIIVCCFGCMVKSLEFPMLFTKYWIRLLLGRSVFPFLMYDTSHHYYICSRVLFIVQVNYGTVFTVTHAYQLKRSDAQRNLNSLFSSLYVFVREKFCPTVPRDWAGWCVCVVLCSEGSRFESRPGHWLSALLYFLVVLRLFQEFWYSRTILSRFVQFIHYSRVIRSRDAICP